MLKQALGVVVGCTLASNAMALPFQAFQVSAGGGMGPPGQPVTVTGGVVHQDPMGDDSPPASTAIAGQPSLEFDSYVALDSLGPSTAMYSSAAALISAQPFVTPGALSGQWGNPGGVPSSLTGLFGVDESVFVARLVVTAGAMVDGPLLVGSVLDEGGPETIESELTILDNWARPAERGGGAEYLFVGLRSVSPFAAQALGSPTFDVYDIYLVRQIPAPGAGSLCVIGLLALRRRRERA